MPSCGVRRASSESASGLSLKVIGIDIRTLTGLPSCMPGVNFASLTTRMASSSRSELTPRLITTSCTPPSSLTTNCTNTRPSTPALTALSGYITLLWIAAIPPTSSGISSTTTCTPSFGSKKEAGMSPSNRSETSAGVKADRGKTRYASTNPAQSATEAITILFFMSAVSMASSVVFVGESVGG